MASVLDALPSNVKKMLMKKMKEQVQMLNKKLMKMIKEEVKMLHGVPKEIDKLKVKLNDLKNFLADADKGDITEERVQTLVTELRGAMRDATGIIDSCRWKSTDRGPSRDMGWFSPLLFCLRNPLHTHKIGRRIKKLNKKLSDIKTRGDYFNFANVGFFEGQQRKEIASPPFTRETSGELDESGLVGAKIKDDMRNLVEMLTKVEQEYNKIRVFAIVGVGGTGKTTLAKKILNNDIIQQKFTKKIWLCVHQDFNEIEILRQCIIGAGVDYHAAGNTKVTLEETLKETMTGHKTLLVMDDVWDHHVWEDVLRDPLSSVLFPGSCVLVTTRHDTVARGMNAVEPHHHVEKIEPEGASSLLKKQNLEEIDKTTTSAESGVTELDSARKKIVELRTSKEKKE